MINILVYVDNVIIINLYKINIINNLMILLKYNKLKKKMKLNKVF
mgnify:CR=1 FL=1